MYLYDPDFLSFVEKGECDCYLYFYIRYLLVKGSDKSVFFFERLYDMYCEDREVEKMTEHKEACAFYLFEEYLDAACQVAESYGEKNYTAMGYGL
jgi:hypothetical protein